METLASVSVYESNFSSETSAAKIHRNMRRQQCIVLSEKS